MCLLLVDFVKIYPYYFNCYTSTVLFVHFVAEINVREHGRGNQKWKTRETEKQRVLGTQDEAKNKNIMQHMLDTIIGKQTL